MKKLLLISLLTVTASCSLPQADPPPSDNTVSKPVENIDTKPPVESEAQLIENYQKAWDAVVLDNAEDFNMQVKGFPNYETYLSSFDTILNKMSAMTQAGSNISYPKLEKLRLKLLDSKKYTTALKNYLKYGQPIMESDITNPCESYLRENLNDPGSLDIIDTKIEGQNNKGWVVWVKYRAKNGFGALALQVSKFEVQYSATDKRYNVINAQ